METANTQDVVPKKSNRWAMLLSCLLAFPLAGVLLIHPAAMLDAQGHYNHSALMLVMIGISGGFIHGIGFVPHFSVWKWLFSPFVAWPLMLYGYFIWFIQ